MALFPLTLAVPTGFPFSNNVKVTDPLGLPVPETETVRLEMVTFEGLGLFIVTFSTFTLEAPGNWLELDEDPAFTWIVTWVGVEVGVEVAVLVAVEVLVFVAVLVGVRVAVSV